MARVTSVKEFRIEREATADSLGAGSFVFTDDYSVFDWGKMPDQIPEKGASLCTMGAFNFELLEAEGVPTHYRGVVDHSGDSDSIVSLEDASSPPWEMAIELTQVPRQSHSVRCLASASQQCLRDSTGRTGALRWLRGCCHLPSSAGSPRLRRAHNCLSLG